MLAALNTYSFTTILAKNISYSPCFLFFCFANGSLSFIQEHFFDHPQALGIDYRGYIEMKYLYTRVISKEVYHILYT